MTNRINDKIDINQAAVEELCTIKGVGASLADRIMAARPYETLDDLKRVKGVGDKLFMQMLPYLFIGGQPADRMSESALLEQPVMEDKDGTQPEAAQAVQIEAEPYEISVQETAPAERPTDEQVVETIDQPDIKTAGKIAEIDEKEPFIAVGETSQSVFYPVEDEPLAASAKSEQAKEQKPLQAIQVIERPRERQDTARQPAKPSLQRREMLTWLAGASLLSILLGVLLTLGILGIVNGSLRYPSMKQAQVEIAALQGQLDINGEQIADAQESITSLRTRMDTLETLSGRISTLETETADIRSELTETTGQMEEISGSLDEISDEIDMLIEEIVKVKEAAGLFENFLQQLQALLNDIIPAEIEGGLQ